MTICAKFDGRSVRECTRGLNNCSCALDLLKEAHYALGEAVRTSKVGWIQDCAYKALRDHFASAGKPIDHIANAGKMVSSGTKGEK